jgi:uncharacterized protein
MGIEANKQLVHQFMQLFSTNDYAAMATLMTDDATWTVPGDLPISGEHPKDEMIKVLEQMQQQFATPVQWIATGMIAEGDSVAAECESSVDTSRGRQYRNKYHIVFHFHGGRISRLVEYCDTKHVNDVFLTP